MKNTHGGVLLLVKFQDSACNFIKSNTSPWVFSRFLICTNDTKLRKASDIETLQFIACVNQFTGFYTIETLALNELNTPAEVLVWLESRNMVLIVFHSINST